MQNLIRLYTDYILYTFQENILNKCSTQRQENQQRYQAFIKRVKIVLLELERNSANIIKHIKILFEFQSRQKQQIYSTIGQLTDDINAFFIDSLTDKLLSQFLFKLYSLSFGFFTTDYGFSLLEQEQSLLEITTIYPIKQLISSYVTIAQRTVLSIEITKSQQSNDNIYTALNDMLLNSYSVSHELTLQLKSLTKQLDIQSLEKRQQQSREKDEFLKLLDESSIHSLKEKQLPIAELATAKKLLTNQEQTQSIIQQQQQQQQQKQQPIIYQSQKQQPIIQQLEQSQNQEQQRINKTYIQCHNQPLSMRQIQQNYSVNY